MWLPPMLMPQPSRRTTSNRPTLQLRKSAIQSLQYVNQPTTIVPMIPIRVRATLVVVVVIVWAVVDVFAIDHYRPRHCCQVLWSGMLVPDCHWPIDAQSHEHRGIRGAE
jgi:hypothetical protein